MGGGEEAVKDLAEKVKRGRAYSRTGKEPVFTLS